MWYLSVTYAGSWTGRTSFERPNLQSHSRPNELLLIHGPSLGLANSGQDLSSPRTLHQMAYENISKCIHVLKKASFICLICVWNFSLEITGNRIIRTCIVILYTHEMNALNHKQKIARLSMQDFDPAGVFFPLCLDKLRLHLHVCPVFLLWARK